jgi:hypothetical protein
MRVKVAAARNGGTALGAGHTSQCLPQLTLLTSFAALVRLSVVKESSVLG